HREIGVGQISVANLDLNWGFVLALLPVLSDSQDGLNGIPFTYVKYLFFFGNKARLIAASSGQIILQPASDALFQDILYCPKYPLLSRQGSVGRISIIKSIGV